MYVHALCIRINSEFPPGPSCTPPSRFSAATQIRTRVHGYIVYCFCSFFHFTVSKPTASHPTLIFPIDVCRDNRYRLANVWRPKRFMCQPRVSANAADWAEKRAIQVFDYFVASLAKRIKIFMENKIERNLVHTHTHVYTGRQWFSAVGGFLNFSQLNGTPEVLRRDKSSEIIRGAREKQRSFPKRAKCTRKRVQGYGSGGCHCRSDRMVATPRNPHCMGSLNHIGGSGEGGVRTTADTPPATKK